MKEKNPINNMIQIHNPQISIPMIPITTNQSDLTQLIIITTTITIIQKIMNLNKIQIIII